MSPRARQLLTCELGGGGRGGWGAGTLPDFSQAFWPGALTVLLRQNNTCLLGSESTKYKNFGNFVAGRNKGSLKCCIFKSTDWLSVNTPAIMSMCVHSVVIFLKMFKYFVLLMSVILLWFVQHCKIKRNIFNFS
jgi:hypothetical protein